MINWKLRFQNKTTLTAIILGVIALVYQVLDLFGVIPPFPQDKIVDVAMLVVDILVLVGVVIDPTTSGASDSARAMGYTIPYKDKKKE